MPHRHENRSDLAGEHALTDIGQMVGCVLFFMVWVIDSFVLNFSTFASGYIPVYIRYPLAAILLLMSLYLAVKGLKIVFGEVREPPSVIKKSVFGWVRHPVYLSELVLYLGLFFITVSLFSLLVVVIVFLFLNYVATVEEKMLEERFGDEYKEYKKSVGKWFPKVL